MAKKFNNILKTSNIPKNCRERFLNLDAPESSALNSYGIHYSGISFLREGYQMGNPVPSESHMLIFTMGGEGYLITRENEYTLKQNSLISVPAGNACMFGVKDDDWSILWFYMRPVSHWKVLAGRGVRLSAANLTRQMENSMESYLAEFGSPGIPAGNAASLLAKLICVYLDRALDISEISVDMQMRNSMENIWKLVRDAPEEKWELNDLSARLNMSVSTFQRLVKKYYFTSAWQKVIEIRMEQAKIMVLNTDYPLKVIAGKLGYADEFVFSNAFRRYYGTFPRIYRKNIDFNL